MNSANSRATGELINIIKELFYNARDENTDERDRIIKKVDSQFVECDSRIDKYIRNSSKDLSHLIKLFNEIATKIELSRSNVNASREALKQCKVLLQSKRDDVRRLWLEWCEQRCFYNNLAKLKQIYMAGEQIEQMCSANERNYVEAACLITSSLKRLDDEFNEINGLNEIKRTIGQAKQNLEKRLIDELNEQFYDNVTRSVLETGTSFGSNRETSFKRRHFNQQFHNNNNNNNQKQTSSSSMLSIDDEQTIVKMTSEQMIESVVQSAAQLNQIETGNLIEKLLAEINRDMMNRLIQIIHLTSTHVVESNLIDNNKILLNTRQSVENNPKFLCQLIDLTFEQFKIMAKLYKYFIECIVKHAALASVSNKYQWSNVWTCIQNVLVQLLDEYLDIKQLNQLSMMSDADLLDKIDINSYFVRKRFNLPFGGDQSSQPFSSNQGNQQSQNSDDERTFHRIFTFKGSSHAMSITNYIREQNNENLFTSADVAGSTALAEHSNALTTTLNDQRVFKILVCVPEHRNITTIFSTMEHILKEISDELRSVQTTNMTGSGDNTSAPPAKPDLVLEKFLQDFILNTFITNAVESIKENARIYSSLDSGKYEISKQLISLSTQKELGLTRPILQNSIHVYESCVDLFNLIKDMNSYACEFTRAMYSLIEKHIEHCNKLFTSIVMMIDPETNESNYVYSMVWVQDEGIKKYFKQLPAFSLAIKGKPPLAALTSSNKLINKNLNLLTNTSTTTITTATTNLNSLNPGVLAAQVDIDQFELDLLSKEVDTLISNLNDNVELAEINIITNFNYIEMIAHLHESSDWLIGQLKHILNSLEQMVKNPKSLNNSLSLGELNRLVKLVDDLDKWGRGDTLLLLYLETRVHCFYHLINFIKQENNTSYSGDLDTDPDECVLNMNRDLHRIHEHLSRSLQEHKVKYVFDALGFMIATIFVKAIKNFKKISTHGIAKMCRNIFNVEQNLSAIRNKSDPHLMKAHRFYELLYKKPEELLNHLMEHEAEFQLSDYTNLLNLIYRSQPGNEINSLSVNTEALNKILKQNK